MKRFHYGWIISLCCMILLMCTNGFPANVFASYLPFLKERGYSGVQTSSLVTIRCIAAFVGMSLVPFLYKHVNIRWGLSISGLFLFAAFFTHSLAQDYWIYALGATLMGVGYGLGGMIPISILINNWFVRLRATSISICCIGTGLSAVILPPLIVRIAKVFSLALAFRMTAWLSLLISVLTFVIIRDTPREKGLFPYGADTAVEKAAKRRRSGGGQDLSRGTRYIMLFALAQLGGVAMSAAAHYATLFTSVGYSAEMAALSISILGISLTVSKLLFGPAIDWWGGKKASVVFLAVLTAGIVSCCLSPMHPIFMYAGTALMGLGFSPATVGISIYAEDFSSKEYYPVLLKNFQRAYMFGGIIFSSVPGKLYDIFGNYIVSYWMFTAMTIIFAIVLVAAYRVIEK